MDQRVVFLKKKLLNLEAELNALCARQSESHLRELQRQRELALNTVKLQFEQRKMVEKLNSLSARSSELHLRELRRRRDMDLESAKHQLERQETTEEFEVNQSQRQSQEKDMSSRQDSSIDGRDEIDG